MESDIEREFRFFEPNELSGRSRAPSDVGADSFIAGVGSGLGTGIGVAAGILAAAWVFSKMAK